MNFEKVFDSIGHFGLYQALVYACCLWFAILHGWQAVGIVYFGYEQPHWCRIEALEEYSYDDQVYIAIPWDAGRSEYEDCQAFDLDFNNYTDEEFQHWNRSVMTAGVGTKSCPNGWVHNTTEMPSTMLTEWNTVCKDFWLVQMTATAYMAGMLVGSIMSGLLADRYGRLKPTIVFSSLHPVFAIAAAFSPDVYLFIFLRFMMSIASFSAFLGGFVIIAEVIGPKYRNPTSITYNTFFAFGGVLLSLVAYFVRDFRYLQVVMGLPAVLTPLFYFILPESPRWLIVQKRYDEAMAILEKIAKINGTFLPQDLDLSETQAKPEENAKEGTLFEIYQLPGLRKVIFILYLIWVTCSLVYYGLALNVGSLVGDIYLNGFLMSFAEMPANVLGIYGNTKIGRRLTLAISLLVAGFSNLICIPLLVTQKADWLLTAFVIIGKASVTISFAVSFLFTAELFPTEVRQVALGSCSMFSRFGGMVSPYVGGPLGDVWIALPSLIFGLFGVTSGALTFLLPETRAHKMPDSLEEAEILARGGKLAVCQEVIVTPMSDDTKVENKENQVF